MSGRSFQIFRCNKQSVSAFNLSKRFGYENRSGTSARGEWKVQTFVIETQDQYPRKMAFDVFGADRLAQFAINVGDNLRVSFDIDAHEYNGRWFNNIRAFSVMHVDAAAAAAAAPVAAAPAQPAAPAPAPFPPAAEGESADDLPF